MNPLIKYRGGKSKELPHILPFIPDFGGRYMEPFFGGGALYLHLEPRRAVINDINRKLITFYRGVRDDFDNFSKELTDIDAIYKSNRRAFDNLKESHPDERVADGNEELYYRLRDMYNGLIDKEYSDALLYYFINKTSYSGMIRYNAKGEFNVPFGRYKTFNITSVTEAHSRLLASAEILNADYSRVFDMAEADDFMFLDPPYDCVFSDYGNTEYRNGFNDEAHEELADRFRRLRCPALMVIGRTPLTERLYGDLIVDEYAKSYAVNIRNRFKSTASHILVANYQLNNHRLQF